MKFNKLLTLFLIVSLFAPLVSSCEALFYKPTEGLVYEKVIDKEEYWLQGIGDVNVEKLVIPTEVDGIPVTHARWEGIIFKDSPVKSVYIPKSITQMDDYYYSYVKGTERKFLDEIVVSKKNKVYDSRDNCNAFIETSTDTLLVASKNTVIPKSVKHLGNTSYAKMDLKTFVIPEQIISLQNFVFAGCKSLEEVVIPDGVQSLGIKVFGGCESLKEIVLPNSIKSLGDHVFSCSALKEITLPGSIQKMGKGIFDGCTNLKTVTLNEGIKYISESMFKGCTSLETVYIPSSVRKIEYNAFNECDSLKTIYYNGSKEMWDENVLFSNASILLNVEIIFTK